MPENMNLVPANSPLRALSTKKVKVVKRSEIEEAVRKLADGHALVARGFGNQNRAAPSVKENDAEILMIIHRVGSLVTFVCTGPYTFVAHRNPDGYKRLFIPYILPFLVTMSKVHNTVRFTHLIRLKAPQDIRLAHGIKEALDTTRGEQRIGSLFFSNISNNARAALRSEVAPYLSATLVGQPTAQGNGVMKKSVPPALKHLVPSTHTFDAYRSLKSSYYSLMSAIRGLNEGQAVLARGYGMNARVNGTRSSEIIIVAHRVRHEVFLTCTGTYTAKSCWNSIMTKLEPPPAVFISAMSIAHAKIAYTDIIQVEGDHDVKLAYAIQKECDVQRGETRVGLAFSDPRNNMQQLQMQLKPYTMSYKECSSYPTKRFQQSAKRTYLNNSNNNAEGPQKRPRKTMRGGSRVFMKSIYTRPAPAPLIGQPNGSRSKSLSRSLGRSLSRSLSKSLSSLNSLRRAVDALNNTAASNKNARAPELLPVMSGSMGSKSPSLGLNLNVERLARKIVSNGVASPSGFSLAQVELAIRKMSPVSAMLMAVRIRGTPDVIHLLARRKGPEVALAFSGGFRHDTILTANGTFRPPLRPFLEHMSTIYGPVDVTHMLVLQSPEDLRAASRLLRDPRLNAHLDGLTP
jgi:hypothetical protein